MYIRLKRTVQQPQAGPRINKTDDYEKFPMWPHVVSHERNVPKFVLNSIRKTICGDFICTCSKLFSFLLLWCCGHHHACEHRESTQGTQPEEDSSGGMGAMFLPSSTFAFAVDFQHDSRLQLCRRLRTED